MKKLETVKDVVIIVGILVLCVLVLKWTYNDGIKNCTDYGYSETYCHNALVK